jgi:hypothetical protein
VSNEDVPLHFATQGKKPEPDNNKKQTKQNKTKQTNKQNGEEQ